MDPGNKTEKGSLTERDDYLWDGSGEPDPEVQRLEALLGKYRHDRPAPVFPAIVPHERWIFRLLPRRQFPALATAVALLAITVGAFLLYVRKQPTIGGPGWDVSSLAGTPRIGRKIIREKGSNRLGVGQLVETDSQSRASLQAEDIGQIEM